MGSSQQHLQEKLHGRPSLKIVTYAAREGESRCSLTCGGVGAISSDTTSAHATAISGGSQETMSLTARAVASECDLTSLFGLRPCPRGSSTGDRAAALHAGGNFRSTGLLEPSLIDSP